MTALAAVCAGLLFALALWRQGEPRTGHSGFSLDASADRTPVAERFDRPGLLADPLPEIARTRAIAGTPSNAVDLRFVPNEDGVRVCGTVRLADDAHAVTARVALFGKKSTEPDAAPLHEASCAEDGKFCVSADGAGDFAIAIFAPGYRPGTRVLELSRGTVEDVGEVRLERGAAIEGLVRADGEPQSGVELVAILESSGTIMRTSDGALRWSRGRFEWSYTTARNDADGRYRIAGLRAGDYRVRICAMRGPGAVFGYKTLEAMSVEAPSDDIDFLLSTSAVDMRIESASHPVGAASAELEAHGAHLGRTSDDDGRVTIRTLPDIDCNLIVRKKGYAPRLIPFETPPAGETRHETIELEPAVEAKPAKLASLAVELVPSTGERITAARFEFYDADSGNVNPRFHRFDAHAEHATGTASSTFSVDQIPSGHYRVVIQAGRPLTRSRAPPITKFCDTEFEIVIPGTGGVSRRVALETRGSVEVTVRDEKGRPLAAQVRLLTLDGHATRTIAADEGWSERTTLGDDGETTFYVEVCDGDFELEVSCTGYAPRRIPFRLASGTVSRIDATLSRK